MTHVHTCPRLVRVVLMNDIEYDAYLLWSKYLVLQFWWKSNIHNTLQESLHMLNICAPHPRSLRKSVASTLKKLYLHHKPHDINATPHTEDLLTSVMKRIQCGSVALQGQRQKTLQVKFWLYLFSHAATSDEFRTKRLVHILTHGCCLRSQSQTQGWCWQLSGYTCSLSPSGHPKPCAPVIINCARRVLVVLITTGQTQRHRDPTSFSPLLSLLILIFLFPVSPSHITVLFLIILPWKFLLLKFLRELKGLQIIRLAP